MSERLSLSAGQLVETVHVEAFAGMLMHLAQVSREIASKISDSATTCHSLASPSVGCGDTPTVGDAKEGEEGFVSSSPVLRGGEDARGDIDG